MNQRGCVATGVVIIENFWEMYEPRSGRRRADNVLTMPSLESPTTAAIASGLTESDIARRAFEVYCDRGREDGHDVKDRLTGERELRTRSNSSAA
jgi:hypothetical protein